MLRDYGMHAARTRAAIEKSALVRGKAGGERGAAALEADFEGGAEGIGSFGEGTEGGIVLA